MRHFLIIAGISVASIAIGTALFLFGGDNSFTYQGATVNTGVKHAQAAEVPFKVVVEGDRAVGVETRKNIAVYDQDGLERLWSLVYGENAPALPAIDFDTEYAIGVFAGTQSSGGHDIAIERVLDDGSTRTVSISLMAPGEGCVTTQALTSPFQIVRVPFSSLTLARGDEQVVKVPCL